MKRVKQDQGWEVGLYEIGAADAADMLTRMMPNQRSPSEASIRNLVAEMIALLFGISNDAIVITKSGMVINGQHRLTAIVRTGIAQTFIILTIPDDEMCKTLRLIDCGVARTIGHVAAMTISVSNSGKVAAIAKMAIGYDRGLFTTQGCYSSTNRTTQEKFVSRSEVLDYISAHAKALQYTASFVNQLNAEYGLLGTSGPGFVHYMVTRKHSQQTANEFITVAFCGKGEGAESVEPLRKALIKNMTQVAKVPSHVKIVSLMKAFKSWMARTVPSKGFINLSDPVPKI